MNTAYLSIQILNKRPSSSRAIILLLWLCNTSYAHEIAITFDDLPCSQEESIASQIEINEKILDALAKFKAPAIGFVNEGKLYGHNETKKKISILKAWAERGHDLGNHTYTHKKLSNTKFDVFKADILKGEKISKTIMKSAGKNYCFFRHPYLDTGSTHTLRQHVNDFLNHSGYIVAPVTIDTDDYRFNDLLLKNPRKKQKILQKYLDHTRAKFAFYEAASNKIFGYNIKHVWLLHVNLINAYAMEDLLKMARDLGYKFIPLQEALADKAYDTPDTYYTPFGVSWLYRWDASKGKVVNWSKDPEPDSI